MRHFDSYVIRRLFSITLFVLLVLIFIFIMIDFSENSDDFTDRGAEMSEIWNDYYLNYIPEMIRLVIPVAVFSACLFLTGQLTERLEITALKAAGVSLYRLIVPYLIFAAITASVISIMDAFVIPVSNRERIAFEERFIKQKSERIDRNDIFRELDKNSVLQVNYYDDKQNTAYQVRILKFEGQSLKRLTTATNMSWREEEKEWHMVSVRDRFYADSGFTDKRYPSIDTTLTVLPQDLSRTTSDMYQLTYREATDYLASIERSGAGGINIPKVQFYGRLAYPASIIVVVIIGFAIAAVRRRGGKGIYIALGLTISYLYLAFMKIAEPFGAYGSVPPEVAATLPHIFFFAAGILMLIFTRK